MDHKVVTDYTDATTGNDNIKVFVRARPSVDGGEPPKEMWGLNPKEAPGKLSIKDPSRHVGEHAFLFDQIFWTDTPQDSIYHHVARPLVEHTLKGFNGCCFAYGQTGSGKTYSMFGELGSKRGLIPRCADHVFEFAARQRALNKNLDFSVSVSMLEMYCDEIRDLGRAYVAHKEMKEYKKMNTSDWYLEKVKNRHSFGTGGGPKSPDARAKSPGGTDEELGLAIHEDLSGNVYVKNLSVIPVSKSSEVHDVLERGFRLRATHETKMNKYSSRSHTIFTLTVSQTDTVSGITTTGRLNLVDLAGSERLSKSEAEGQRLKETLSINRSLSALGKIAASLDPSTPAGYIPYRDSKLTRLLQNSLGGNSHTSVIATLHPTRQNYDECLSTLQFANRCRCVVNQPRINYTDAQGRGILQETIRRLQAEIKRLRLMMAVVLAKKNKQFEEILKQLGHAEAKVLNDGRVQMGDGKVVGAKLDLKSIERQVTSAQQKAELGSGVGGMAFQGLMTANMTSKEQLMALNHQQQMQLMASMGLSAGDSFDLANLDLSQADLLGQFEEMGGDASVFGLGFAGSQILETADEGKVRAIANALKSENARLKERLRKHKDKSRAAETEHRAASVKSREEIKLLRSQVAGMKRELSESVAAAKGRLAAQKDSYESQIKSVIVNSNNAQKVSRDFLKRIPDSLRVDSAKILAANKRAQIVEDELVRKHGEHVRQILRSRDDQIANVRSQAQYWVKVKDDECQKLVDDFNRYHRKRSSQVHEYRKELFLLYDHCNRLTSVINKVQAGAFRVRVASERTSLLRQICIPQKDTPSDKLLTDERRLALLKEQIRALRDFERTAQGSKPPTLQLEQNTITTTTTNNNNNRTESTTQPAQLIIDTSSSPKSTTINYTSEMELLKDTTHDGVQLDADVSTLGQDRLRDLVQGLRSFISSQHLSDVFEQKLMRKISSNATMSYIKTLEEGLETYKQSFRAEAESHKQLRIAYQSLKRRVARRAGLRPSTAKK